MKFFGAAIRCIKKLARENKKCIGSLGIRAKKRSVVNFQVMRGHRVHCEARENIDGTLRWKIVRGNRTTERNSDSIIIEICRVTRATALKAVFIEYQ